LADSQKWLSHKNKPPEWEALNAILYRGEYTSSCSLSMSLYWLRNQWVTATEFETDLGVDKLDRKSKSAVGESGRRGNDNAEGQRTLRLAEKTRI
jgi:hypothetical protein